MRGVGAKSMVVVSDDVERNGTRLEWWDCLPSALPTAPLNNRTPHTPHLLC